MNDEAHRQLRKRWIDQGFLQPRGTVNAAFQARGKGIVVSGKRIASNVLHASLDQSFVAVLCRQRGLEVTSIDHERKPSTPDSYTKRRFSR